MLDNNINNHTFDKEVTCPICEAKFKTKAVKVNSPRIASKDSDFFIRYNVVNPYFYDVWLCNSCGYAALKVDFPSVKSYQKQLVLNSITKKWNPREYPDLITPTLAIERYKLAFVNALALEKPHSTLGMIMLKISWMYRLLEDKKNEDLTLHQALSSLEKAYTLESFPLYGLQRDSMTYLIGDLNRRLNNDSQALLWYSKAITTLGASSRVKELARDGKDLITNKNLE